MTSNKTFARMYLGNKIHSQSDKPTAHKTGLEKSIHRGDLIAMHAPRAPDVAEYDAWLQLQLAGTRGRQTTMTGRKLHRIVTMRRQGSSLKECGEAVGMTTQPIYTWLSRLPKELSA